MTDDMNKRRNPTAFPSAMDYAEHLEKENDSLKAQVDMLATFINKWLDFEESCIKKDGPYVNLPIPKLMTEAREALEQINQLLNKGE